MNIELKLRKDLMDFICSFSISNEKESLASSSKRRYGSKTGERKSSKHKSRSTKKVDSKSIQQQKSTNLKPDLEKVVDFNNPENVTLTSSPKKPPRPGSQKPTMSTKRHEKRSSIIDQMPNIKWNFEKGEPEPDIEYPQWMAPFNCNGLFDARFDLLPMELILKIFKQITPSDRLAAGTTCRRWMEASHYYEPFLDQTYYHFDRVEFGDQEGPFKYFSKGFRHYPRLTFTQVNFNKHSEFWTNRGLWITELTLRSCIIKKKKFISIMKNLLNLRRLELMQCDELFKSWPLEHNWQEPMFPFFLFCLRHISLSGCDYFNEYHFERFVTMAPNLRSIDVSNCFINLYLSKRITMLDRVMKLINKNRYLLNSLNIADTPCVDDFTWHCLSEIDDLSLSHLTVSYCDRVPLKDPGIIRFLGQQTKLTHLNLASSTGLNDECLQIIITNCPLLHTLNIRRCWLISDEGVLDMHALQHLRVLDISSCERISDYGIMTGIVGKRPRELHELYLNILNNLTDSTLYYMAVTFRNIQILDLDSTANCVTDASIQYIACFLHNLKQLNVTACSKLTDAGFTGIDLPQKTFAIWDIEETFSIDRLKRLRTLTVSGCYKITDFTLRYAFRFMELKELNISRCPQISKQGIEKLVTNCPALEYLDLSECPNINDSCIELVSMYLKRLSTLKLTNCALITEDSLKFLSHHCQNLKYLYVRGCLKLPSDIMERLSKITTLRQVYKS
ncbi:F-box and leucine-rich repeat protein 13-like isoform X1 [Malaya genurostris]|uniref:F-box and leucine-rich repeat protein 13-like isoform X1 n=1 Tax=Malaya genurostris TaxID=325434 RepID=UPI0026F40527|nr:F-box and leucine-rich repeat protein 13-like isoform X1 [Malaya genurostris]